MSGRHGPPWLNRFCPSLCDIAPRREESRRCFVNRPSHRAGAHPWRGACHSAGHRAQVAPSSRFGCGSNPLRVRVRWRILFRSLAHGPFADTGEQVVGFRQRGGYRGTPGRVQCLGQAIMEHARGLDECERHVLAGIDRKPASQSQQSHTNGRWVRQPGTVDHDCVTTVRCHAGPDSQFGAVLDGVLQAAGARNVR